MERNYLYTYLLLGLLLYSIDAQSQAGFINFNSITREDGLGHNHVECIFQSEEGFIWFGTRNGLTRYDGYELRTFHPSDKPYSISGNWILTINEDLQDNLWVGSMLNGVSRLDKKTGKFYHYGSEYGFGDRINRISVLKDGSVWLCTEHGLAEYLAERDSFRTYLPDPDDSNSLNAQRVYDLIQSSSGKCYVATWHNDIQLFDRETRKFHNISYERSPELNVDYRKRIIEDNEGMLWISAYQHGLCRLNPQTGESRLFTRKSGELTTNILTGDMVSDHEGNIWIATDGEGISIFHSKDQTFTHIRAGSGSNNLPGNQIYSLLMDNQNTLWVGFYDKGVAMYNPLNSKFQKTLLNPSDLKELNNKSVISIFQDSNHRVWAGTDGDGLYLFDPEDGMRVFKHDPYNPNSISANVITSIAEDPVGRILAGTYAGGLNIMDLENERILRFTQGKELDQSVNSSSIWEIYCDSRDKIWLGLLGNGIDLFDFTNYSFTNYGPASERLNRIEHPNIMIIFEDNDGDIWFGTEGNGVFILDEQTDKITRMLTSNDTTPINSSLIRSFFQDRNGLIWIGTEGEGVYVFNKKNGDLKQFSTRDGLPDMIIQGILQDDRGNIWITTGYGLSMYSPYSEKFINFSTADGLAANEFNADAFIQLKDGRMMAGSTGGLDIFRPSEIVVNQNIPRVMITGMEIQNKPVNPGDTINNRVLLDKQICYTNEIVLCHQDKTFSFEFAALNYILPQKCQYKYRLLNFDDEWIPTPSDRRRATYTNLSPGEYLFQVKASNNDGKWGNNIRELKILILPPFWLRWWFITALTLGILMVIYGIYRTRLNFYKSKFMQQQALQEKKIVEMQKESLENELNQLTFYRLSRDRVLLDMKKRLEGMALKARESVKTGLGNIIMEIDKEIGSDVEWKYIEPQLDRTYNNFITRLKDKHQDLSASELKIAAYIRMNLSTKEISEFMHKTVRAVENDRYRLRKKLNLDSGTSLSNYLMNI